MNKDGGIDLQSTVAEMDGYHLHGKDAWLASKQVSYSNRIKLMMDWVKTAVFESEISHS